MILYLQHTWHTRRSRHTYMWCRQQKHNGTRISLTHTLTLAHTHLRRKASAYVHACRHTNPITSSHGQMTRKHTHTHAHPNKPTQTHLLQTHAQHQLHTHSHAQLAFTHKHCDHTKMHIRAHTPKHTQKHANTSTIEGHSTNNMADNVHCHC